MRGVTSGGSVGQSHFKMMQSFKNSLFGVLAVWYQSATLLKLQELSAKGYDTARDAVNMHRDVKYYVFN